MKQLIILVILVVAGYFAYQHFFSEPQQETATEEEDGSDSIDELPAIPGKCERPAKDLQNAMYGAASGEVSAAQRNTAEKKFRSCLRSADFTDAQIRGAVAEIEERVKGYLEQDNG